MIEKTHHTPHDLDNFIKYTLDCNKYYIQWNTKISEVNMTQFIVIEILWIHSDSFSTHLSRFGRYM